MVSTSQGIPQVFSEGDAQEWKNELCRSDSPEILFCITVYNESGSALLYSLAGIKRNIEYLISLGKRSIAERITLCLIFDGQEKMSASASALIEALELYSRSQNSSEAAMHIFDSKLNLELITKCMYADAVNNPTANSWLNAYQLAVQQDKNPEIELFESESDYPVSPRTLLCIKAENAGKLNSHWWFFTVLSSYLRPRYCVQMDVGSIPIAHNICELWGFLEQHPNVGSATGSLLVPEPHRPWHCLSLWQFGNFCLDKLLFRPAEVIAGYLSVLPGQFSILRWQTLIASLDSGNVQTQRASPLKKYFRGLGQLGAFESNMFLAEDRVLGFEIITSTSKGWKLAYLDSVVTVTDPCQSLMELLRQRRRWINGSLACRIWSFARIPQYLSEKQVGIVRKLRFLTSVPLHLLRSLTEWFYPSLSILFCVLVYQGTQYLLADSLWLTKTIDWVFSATLLLMSLQALLWQFPQLCRILLVGNIVCSCLFLMIALTISIGSGYYLPSFIIALLLLVTYGFSRAYSSPLATNLWKYFPLYLLINGPVTFLLNIYAFFNVHDCSWGTKGLTGGKFQKRYRRYYVSLWLISNLILLTIALSFQSFIPILVLVSYLDLIVGIAAGAVAAVTVVARKIYVKKSSSY